MSDFSSKLNKIINESENEYKISEKNIHKLLKIIEELMTSQDLSTRQSAATMRNLLTHNIKNVIPRNQWPIK